MSSQEGTYRLRSLGPVAPWRARIFCLVTTSLVAMALVPASPARATHGPNSFSGTWTTNIGGVGFRVVTQAVGAPALQGLAGQPCAAPTTYYRGDYHDKFHTGTIFACTRSTGRLVGRYVADGSTSAHGDGGIDLIFVSPNQFSGVYTGDNFPGMTFPYTGAFQAHIAGDGCCSSSSPRKAKRKRIKGCPAARARRAGAHAASACHWQVRFIISQKGLPAISFPDPAAGFVESETAFVGKVFFNAKPKAGRTSTGRVAGLLVHTDTYQSPVSPFLFPEGEVRVTPLTANYRPGSGEVRLDVRAVVSSVTGPVYSENRDGQSTQAGDGARILATYDFPLHKADVLQTLLGCSQCKGSSLLGLHHHRFLVEQSDKLRVTIGAPRQLAGSCRCLGTTK
jgi:hypothetical protein